MSDIVFIRHFLYNGNEVLIIKGSIIMKIDFKKKKTRWIAFLSVLLVIGYFALDSGLNVVHYQIESSKIRENVRIALVADLHSCYYGENQRDLTDEIEKSNPDIVLLAGDIIDDELPRDYALLFLKWVSEQYPKRVFYVTGNHEYWTGEIDEIRQIVRDFGIEVLEGDIVEFKKNNQVIQVAGINDKDEVSSRWRFELENIASLLDSTKFSVLLTHRPEEIERYLKYDFDLITAGHAHGGQWRIPFLINGLYAPDQGIFPKYAGGRFDFEHSTMIVSRGLARESTRIPRIFNRPEYVIIDLVPKAQ